MVVGSKRVKLPKIAKTVTATIVQRSSGAVTSVLEVEEGTTWADIDGMEVSSGVYVWAYSDGYVRISNGLHAGMAIGISKDKTATKSTVLNTDVIEETTYYALI